jgi:hypothetical protein
MDYLLLAVTGISLVAAIFLGWTAWRLSRAERERSMARVAALAAAAAEPPSAQPQEAPTRSAETVIDVRPQWSAPARARAAARVTAARPVEQEITWAPPRPEELPLRHESAQLPALRDAFLGSAPRAYEGGQRVVATAALLLLFALGAAGAWLYSTPSSPAAAVASRHAPLELVSMRHTRENDRLSVMGLVRNPAAGPVVDRLSATVLLFDQQGGYLTSARSAIDVPRLDPGQESPFTVSVQAPAGATRYRVTFRTEERIVEHVDRRGQVPPAATNSLPNNAAAR